MAKTCFLFLGHNIHSNINLSHYQQYQTRTLKWVMIAIEAGRCIWQNRVTLYM